MFISRINSVFRHFLELMANDFENFSCVPLNSQNSTSIGTREWQSPKTRDGKMKLYDVPMDLSLLTLSDS
jgi:hypothetical protein